MPLVRSGSADERSHEFRPPYTASMNGELSRKRTRLLTTGPLTHLVPVVLVWVIALWLAGCGTGPQGTTSGQPTCCPHTVPDVTGQTGRAAVAHLRNAGVDTIAFRGRWSSRPVGTVLAQHPHAGSFRLHKVTLAASMGRHRPGKHRMIFVPGVATCELTPLPSGSPCAGGPVVLRLTS